LALPSRRWPVAIRDLSPKPFLFFREPKIDNIVPPLSVYVPPHMFPWPLCFGWKTAADGLFRKAVMPRRCAAEAQNFIRCCAFSHQFLEFDTIRGFSDPCVIVLVCTPPPLRRPQRPVIIGLPLGIVSHLPSASPAGDWGRTHLNCTQHKTPRRRSVELYLVGGCAAIFVLAFSVSRPVLGCHLALLVHWDGTNRFPHLSRHRRR